MRQTVRSGSPYEPIIGFSRAVRIGNTIAVGGTAPIGTDGKTVGLGDAAAQTRRCIEIARLALEEAGGSLSDVIRTRIFILRREDWETIGRAHGEAFGAIMPASTMVIAAGFIDPDWLVEIEFDAIVSSKP
jgi:enamine deaminase RidA (YjgF/YER057c/UK114 family)